MKGYCHLIWQDTQKKKAEQSIISRETVIHQIEEELHKSYSGLCENLENPQNTEKPRKVGYL